MFNNVTGHERDMMNFTKNYTMRNRLNRDIQFNEDFRKKYLTNEYGNYEKYDKNKVEVVYDEGPSNVNQDKFYENFMYMLKRLPTKEAEKMNETKRETIEDLITDKIGHQ